MNKQITFAVFKIQISAVFMSFQYLKTTATFNSTNAHLLYEYFNNFTELFNFLVSPEVNKLLF